MAVNTIVEVKGQMFAYGRGSLSNVLDEPESGNVRLRVHGLSANHTLLSLPSFSALAM